MLGFFMLFEFTFQPDKIRREVFSFFVGGGRKQENSISFFDVKVQGLLPCVLPFLFCCQIMVALGYIIRERKCICFCFQFSKIADIVMHEITIQHTKIKYIFSMHLLDMSQCSICHGCIFSFRLTIMQVRGNDKPKQGFCITHERQFCTHDGFTIQQQREC